MTRIVVDNSVVMAWAFEDEADPYCDAVLQALDEVEALAPPVWPLEVADVLCVAERGRRIVRGDAIRFLRLLGQLPIEVVQREGGEDIERLYSLAWDYRLSSYDASYLHLALTEGVPLATRDTALRRALKRAGGSLFKRG